MSTSLLYVIPNLIYSKNPFLIKKLFDIVGSDSNKVRKSVMNVKYWYSSMPDECKVLLHKIVENETFTVVEGTYYRIPPSEVLKRAKPEPDDLEYILNNLSGGNSGVNSKTSSSYSAVLDDAKKKVPMIPCVDGFSLVDKTNDMVFRVSTHKVSLIDKYGNDIVVLNTKQHHSLIIYGAIKGIQITKENQAAWEKVRAEEELKSKILNMYSSGDNNETIQNKKA